MALRNAAGQWSSLLFKTCGDPSLIGDDTQRLPMPKKVVALLAYLVLDPRPHTRQHLAALLWPGADEEKSAMSLRQALSKLREVVGERVSADRTVAQWRDGGDPSFTCDVVQFTAHVNRDPLAATAVEVHRFLAGLTLDDAPEFGQWADATRAQLVRRAALAFRDAGRDTVARNDWSRSADIAAAWMALESHAEAPVALAIEAAYMRRDPDTARALFAAFSARLQVDDDTPSDALHSLVRRLEAMGSMLTRARGVRAVAAPRTRAELTSALYEREHPWNIITGTFSEVARDGRSRTVVIEGNRGTGRSRLMRDALAWMASHHATVLSAQPTESTMALPYVTIGALVKSGLDAPGLGGVDGTYLQTLMQLVPELGPRFPGVARSVASGAASGWTLLDAWVHVLESLAEDEVLVVAVDDVLWCDKESAGMLHAAMERLQKASIVWLYTMPVDEEGDGRVAFRALAVDATRVALAPLSATSVAAILSSVSRLPHDWSTHAAVLHDISHGVPSLLFDALERVRPLDDDWGRVHEGALTAARDLIPPLPSHLVRRLETLTDMEREVLLALVLMLEEGHPVSRDRWTQIPPLEPQLLSHLHGISRLRAARIGEGLVEYQMAVEVDGGFRCISPVLAHHLLTHGSTVRRNELRRVLPRVLQAALATTAERPIPEEDRE